MRARRLPNAERFRGSRAEPSLRRQLAAVEMAETDTKSRGLKRRHRPGRPPSSRRPIGSRLEYPIDGGLTVAATLGIRAWEFG
jgi:hypothetical protein